MSDNTHIPRWKDRLGFSFHRESSPYRGFPEFPYSRFRVAVSATWAKTRELFDEQELLESMNGYFYEDEEEMYDYIPSALSLDEYPDTIAENTLLLDPQASFFDNKLKPVNGICPKCTGLYVHDYDNGRCVNCGYRWCGWDKPLKILSQGRGQSHFNYPEFCALFKPER